FREYRVSSSGAEGFQSLAFTPLFPGPRLIGKVMIYFDFPRALDASEVAFSVLIARQLAFGIDRKRASDALRQTRERIEFLSEAAEVGFWFCDLPLDKLNWDRRVKEHFGFPPDTEVTIDVFYQRVHPDDRDRTRQAIEHSIATKTRYDIEYRVLHPDGQERWIRAIGGASYDDAGHPTRFDGITLDATKRKQAERALMASEDRLRRLAESLDAEVRNRTLEIED